MLPFMGRGVLFLLSTLALLSMMLAGNTMLTVAHASYWLCCCINVCLKYFQNSEKITSTSRKISILYRFLWHQYFIVLLSIRLHSNYMMFCMAYYVCPACFMYRFQGSLAIELSNNHPNMRILHRKIAFILGQWASEVKSYFLLFLLWDFFNCCTLALK